MNEQHGTAKLNILSFPLDVLRGIFACLQDEGICTERGGVDTRYGPEPNNEKLEAIKNSRLVCRTFAKFASPHLLPAISVAISLESIRRFEELTKNPDIAKGIRLVKISLAYRPKEIANDAIRYRDLRLGELTRLTKDLEEAYDDYAAKTGSSPEYLAPLFQVKTRGQTIVHAWQQWNGVNDNNGLHQHLAPPNWGMYIGILAEGFKEYYEKHKEQKLLLENGNFVTRVVEVVTRLPSLGAIVFNDKTDYHPTNSTGYCPFKKTAQEALAVLSTDWARLRKFLVSSEHISSCERPDPATLEFLSVKLLWQIPIAIHEAATKLKLQKEAELKLQKEAGTKVETETDTMIKLLGFCIRAFPDASNFNLLCPRNADGSPAWGPLREAFQSLDSAELDEGTYNHPRIPVTRDPISPEDRGYVHEFVQALLSGPNLVRLDCNLGFLEMHHSFGTLFAKVQLRNITTLIIRDVQFTEQELLAFTGAIGTQLRYIFLNNIHVHPGGWLCPLAALRNKVMEAPSGCAVHLWYLTGGRFEDSRVAFGRILEEYAKGNDVNNDSEGHDGEDDDNEDEYDSDEENEEDMMFWKEAEEYVSGSMAHENPLETWE
ncbi:hypothetical protein OQA88_918 [Cercophora sp. LCS_1]